MTESDHLTHVDSGGSAKMVDISGKPPVHRTARAGGFIKLAAKTVELIRENGIKKGDVLTVAKLAGVMGGKRTSELIPLSHLIEVEELNVTLTLQENGVAIESLARCTGKTGIEMEALTAVSVAALTVYDMCKAVDKTMEIGEIRLLEKTKDPWKQSGA
ncbi:MAG: cyclic pyranopterin monophosphate synthase MoaC [Alkalispirochaetaceae bacterium]